MSNKEIVVTSPGRINIIGEHTDYNNGFVLPAAIDKKAVFKLNKNHDNNTVNIIAANVDDQFSFDLSSFEPLQNGGWKNYVMGVVHQLQLLGADLKGFDGTIDGNVPIGAGMSSSAALECSLAYGLNELFSLGYDKWQLIKASQMAEHHFVGIKCGIMDQFASIMGKKNQVMLLDCQSLEFQYFPFDLGNYQLLLLNTNVSHSLASSEYNARRGECENGVGILQQKFPSVNSLRDISLEQLKQCETKMPQKVYNRCRHVVTENSRVLAATDALLKKDFKRLGQLIYQSHNSLQHDYEVSCPELDYLVELTLDKDYILGSRMMGGGFGGCTINIVEQAQVINFIDFTKQQYHSKFGIDLTPYQVSIEDGASLIN